MKKQRNEFMEQLQIVLDKSSLFENQIAESDKIVKDLEQRIALDVEQLQYYKKEWDELQIEHCNALKEVQDLRSKQGEIKEATQNFDPSLKSRQGRYRSIYKGVWHHMQVAIKMLHHHSLQEPFGLQCEVGWFLPCIFICELGELIVLTHMSLGALTIYLFRT
ncbi:u-box domain-containing protein 33 [Quercus suber]|uniref:RING-type E3 ubiquitin transferase n=1 Tax=Quercus suber TaxID=58331 RepID=A0AAW0JCK5_QUESU